MPSHFLITLPLQEQVDYIDSCQKRVAADTLALETKTTLALVAGTHTYDLPADLVELEGIYNDTVALDDLSMDELLTVLSGVGVDSYLGPQGYAIVGRTLYVLPVPAENDTLTIVYFRRAADFDSQADLEFPMNSAEHEVLEALFDAYVMFDRGETESGLAGMNRYLVEAQKLRANNRGRSGPRLPVIGHDLFL